MVEFLDYKLRLTTRNIVNLENKLGRNPVELLLDIDKGVMPRMGDVIVVLHEALQTYHHGVKLDDVYDIFDKYAEEGHNMFDFISDTFVKLLQESGIVNAKEEEPEEGKN